MSTKDISTVEDVRIANALSYAERYGGIDGDHHKAWVIDQMVRALTGCPVESATYDHPNGEDYVYAIQGESDQYRVWVAGYERDSTLVRGYRWNVGIAP